MVSIQTNLFLPQQRLISKTRTGARVQKRHDTAATPMHRLLTHYSDLVDDHDARHLDTLHRDTDVENLKHRIADIQGNLLELARRRGAVQRRAKTNHVYLSRRKISDPKRANPDESTTQAKRAS